MSKFKDAEEGKPITIKYRQMFGENVATMNFACCDCGLVHNIAYIPLKTRLKMYLWRDNRRTANRRRAKKSRN
jgi:hypothetical protein